MKLVSEILGVAELAMSNENVHRSIRKPRSILTKTPQRGPVLTILTFFWTSHEDAGGDANDGRWR